MISEAGHQRLPRPIRSGLHAYALKIEVRLAKTYRRSTRQRRHNVVQVTAVIAFLRHVEIVRLKENLRLVDLLHRVAAQEMDHSRFLTNVTNRNNVR